MVQMLNEKPKLQSLEIKPFTIGGYEIRTCKYGAYCAFVKEEKDMEETNLQHYKEELKEILLFDYDKPKKVVTRIKENLDGQIKIDRVGHPTDDILEWMAQPYKKPILDNVEREYLSAVIKPYRNKVTFIAKSKDSYEAKYFISIVVKGNYGREAIHLPWFKENTMYKGMELSKKYTVEELGL